MSIYIECLKNGNKKYLRIMESTYTHKSDGSVLLKKKTLKNLGPLERFDDGQPDFLERFREKFKKGELEIEGIEEFMQLAAGKVNLGNADDDYAYLDRKNLGYFFINSVFDQLGIAEILTLEKSRKEIDFDVVGLTRLLTYGRILDPDSKISTFGQKDNYVFSVTDSENEKDIYNVLDVLSDCCEKIQRRMNLRISESSIGRVNDLMFYDVTNYYFETMYNDEDKYIRDEYGNEILVEKAYRKKGVSKEGKQQPIVQMGLFIDSNGIPVSFELFPGNTQDKTTFREMLRSRINNPDNGKVIVVADNGMYAQENFYMILNAGNGYIVSKSLNRSWKKNREYVLDEDGYTYMENSYGEVVFKYKSKSEEKTFKDKKGNSITRNIKTVVYWSKRQYEKTKKDNQKFIEYLESCKEHPEKLKDKKRKSHEFIKVLQIDKETGEVLNTQKVIVLLDEKIRLFQESMGFYSIETSETELSDRDIINKYHGLSRIEDSFRVIKSNLDGRPVYVRTNEHIKAHFLICFIALTIIRIWQYKVLKFQGKDTLNVDGWEEGISAEKLARSLSNFSADKISDDKFKTTKPDKNILMLLNIVGTDRNLIRPTEYILRRLKSDIAHFEL